MRAGTRYQLWDVRCLKDGQKNFLKGLDTKGAINIWKEQHSAMDVMVDGQRTMQVERLLRERDIPFQVTVPDVSQILAKEDNNTGVPLKFPKFKSIKKHGPFSFDWKNFHPLNVVYEFMDRLEAQYPSTCTVSVIGKTDEGRDLKMLKISNSDASNSGVWIDGAIHAREWISTSVVTFIADQIARKFDSLPEHMTNKDWYFLPVMNPDGYAYTHVQDRMWRKNRSCYGGQSVGVDLNRNFSYGWGRSNECSSKEPNHINFRGSEPFSEPESSAVKNIVLSSKIPFKVFLTFHSYSEVITFPWCHSPEPCPDYVNLLEGGTVMAKAIYGSGGHMYKVGSFKDLMYYAAGTSIDWSYGTAHIPYSYLVELRSKTHRFLLPKEEIIQTCFEMFSGTSALMKYVDSQNCYNCRIIPKKSRAMKY